MTGSQKRHIKPGDTLIVLADEKQGIAIPPPDMFIQLAKAIFPQNSPPANGEREEEE